MSQQAVVVIPFYKDNLTYNETFSLEQCFNVLSDYQIIAIKPKSLDLAFVTGLYPFFEVISFDDHYFKNIYGYNQLMLSSLFYKAFLNFEYMLIYQLDAFVFSDQLHNWCNQNYDYIGAPWLQPSENKNSLDKFILHVKSILYRRYNISKGGVPNSKQFVKSVGNGGLSLRRVQRFYDLCIKFRALAEEYISQAKSEFNEDIFWSVAVNRRQKSLSIPPYKTALKFSIETLPELAYRLNQEQLPFGCHAWDKHIGFWRPFLQKFNYKL
ncbi:DUF5672 family protein [Pedobacter metabolipauper]|uniref:DUF5672 domain-containing protein n=1 Tax=Pedobacter metabolipauper TaxID=425513 RepID=A0A4R6SVF7_9SPHI|nr:DUF5672 family protein [Pedobacter metabolipauper]TDQ09361.1 hypothetical protein ATK78_1515 [Pedobacter metabolipauper]